MLKFIESRTKKNPYRIAILLIAIGSMAFLYWYGFYKKFDEDCVPKNVDAIAILDVKNTRNHFAFSYLKNPSEWETTPTKKKFRFSNLGLATPDYLAFFHIENQPLSQWFVSVELQDEMVFEKTATEKHFRKTALQNGMVSYYSMSLAVLIIKYSNKILISNITDKQNQIAIKTAEDLFLKKLFLDPKRIQKTIDTDNVATFWIKKSSLLEKDGILNLKLKDNEITVDGLLNLNPKYQKEWQYLQNSNALIALGFDFEMIKNQKIFTQNTAKINKMIGFNLDSILVHHPTKTELVLNKIIEKKDSAVSYDYDDDFNPIKKVVVHTSREPSFAFSIQTDNPQKIHTYLKAQNAIDNHNVFVNFPLAQTKTSLTNNSLKFEGNPLKNKNLKASTQKIAYLQIHFNQLQPKDWSFLMAKNKNVAFLKSLETLEINISKENNLGHLRACLRTNDEKSLIWIMK